MRKPVDNVNRQGNAPAAASVLELVHTVMHRFRSGQHRALGDAPVAVTHMESKVLGYFGRHPGATQTDLVQHSGRDKAQLARLVKGLRESGLLAAEADADDRRNLHLRLTPDGEAVQRRLRQMARQLEARAMAGFSDDERAQLVGLLARIDENLAG